MRITLAVGIGLLVAGAVVGGAITRGLDGQTEEPVEVAEGKIYFNQDFIEGVQSVTIDLDNPIVVFEHVFKQLPDEVRVHPTENYYYFKFWANSQEISGNMRLDAVNRDKGELSFGYFGAHNKPENIEDLSYVSDAKKLSKVDGVLVKKESALRYRVSYRGKSVVFQLNDLDQAVSSDFPLRSSEQYMARTKDESGFQFNLLYDSDKQSFHFVLDESVTLSDVLYELEEGLYIGRLSGFAFYEDELGRKILIGVDADNVKRNNYYDGPFDQLADNFVKDDSLKKAMEEAYPYVRGRIDNHGVFHGNNGERLDSRLALTPYATFNSYAELRSFFGICRKRGSEAEVINCLTGDYKESVPGAEEK